MKVKNKIQDKSNERLLALVKQIEKTMEKEDRGFIFAPVCQEGDHKSFLALKCGDVVEFWATILSIIVNSSEGFDKEEFERGFNAFLVGVSKAAFPSLIVEEKKNGKNN